MGGPSTATGACAAAGGSVPADPAAVPRARASVCSNACHEGATKVRRRCDDGATTVGVLGTRLSAFLCAWLVVAGGLPVKATRCEQVARLTSRDHWLAMSFFHALRAPLAAHNLVRAAPIHPRRTSLPERLRYPLDRTLFTLCHPLPTDTMRIECPMHKGCARTRPLSRSIGFPATWHGAPLRAIPTSTLRPHPDGCTPSICEITLRCPLARAGCVDGASGRHCVPP